MEEVTGRGGREKIKSKEEEKQEERRKEEEEKSRRATTHTQTHTRLVYITLKVLEHLHNSFLFNTHRRQT